MKGGINALAVFVLDAALTNSISSQKVQKIILDFKTVETKNAENSKRSKNIEGANMIAIPLHNKDGGEYLYKKD